MMIEEPNQEIPDDDAPDWARELTPQPRRDPELPRPAQPSRAPQPAPVPQPQLTRQERDFWEITRMFSPGPNLVALGSMLRADAEQFVAWCNQMGEPGSASWGSTQQAHAAHVRKNLRMKAAELRFEIQAKIPGGLEKTLDCIFGPKCRGYYEELVTLRAREELGI